MKQGGFIVAKKAMVQKELKRQATAEKYKDIRRQLKAEGNYEALRKLPRDSSPTRLHNRCIVTGRPQGYMRQFGLS